MSDTEQNKAIVRRFWEEVLNQGRLEVIDELFADDLVDHSALPGQASGRGGVRQAVEAIRGAFPDFQTAIEDQVAEGDRVATRFRSEGTHQGAFAGMPPPGKRVTVTGITIQRLSEGKIVEEWTNRDSLGLLQQLGALSG